VLGCRIWKVAATAAAAAATVTLLHVSKGRNLQHHGLRVAVRQIKPGVQPTQAQRCANSMAWQHNDQWRPHAMLSNGVKIPN